MEPAELEGANRARAKEKFRVSFGSLSTLHAKGSPFKVIINDKAYNLTLKKLMAGYEIEN
jgi:hypothetical protein